MASRILLVGTARWQATLQRHAEVSRSPSGLRAHAFGGQPFDIVVIDAPSMYISGERVCRDLKARFPASAVVLITAGGAAPASAADLILPEPLGARQLSGAITRILCADPRDVIHCGPFSLNRTTRVLLARGAHSQLSPKLADLIALFLSRPNETLPRAEIMRKVWKTAYLGDTRTLNVHIRRARQVLEPDPQQPRYLKTARGQGYRLEIDAKKERADGGPPRSQPGGGQKR